MESSEPNRVVVQSEVAQNGKLLLVFLHQDDKGASFSVSEDYFFEFRSVPARRSFYWRAFDDCEQTDLEKATLFRTFVKFYDIAGLGERIE